MKPAAMMGTLYNLLWYPALPIALAATRPRSIADVRERLGVSIPIGNADTRSPRIWIHAASVGEVEAIRPIASGLLERHPGAAIIISTMTAAGRDAARDRIPGAAAWLLAPLDSPGAVRSFLARVNPTLVLIAETEVWPNYFLESARGGAKVVVVNGRMSDRSLARYKRASSLFGPVFGSATAILAKTDADARRYLEFNPSARVTVVGDAKLDASASVSDTQVRPELAAFVRGRRVLIAGSTAPGEDAIFVAAWQELRSRFPGLMLVVAPRHLDRVPEIETMLRAKSVETRKASALAPGAADTLLLDTMGELRGLYRHAAIAIVGGSLLPGRGGQSPVEAAAAGVPLLIGPHHENQKDLVASLVQAGGAEIVHDAREIAEKCAIWLSSETARAQAGMHARETLELGRGAAKRTVEHIENLLAGGS